MSNWRRGVAAGLLSVAIAGTAVAVPTTAFGADKRTQINSNISKLQDQLNQVSGEEADLLRRLDEINTRKAEVESQISGVQTQMDQTQRELDAATAKLEAARAAVRGAEAELADAQRQLGVMTDQMREQAIDAYIGKEPTASMSKVIMAADDLRQASAASAYMRQIVADRREVVEEHRELEGKARDIRKELVRFETQAETERKTIDERKAQLDSQRGELDGLRAKVQTEVDAQGALVKEAETRRNEFESQIAGLQAESDRIAATLRALPSAPAASSGGGGGGRAVPAPSGNGRLLHPISGWPMTSPFGTRVHPIFGTTRLHAGQDYGAPTGTPIRAAADGTVVTAGFVSGYGNYTCINHGGGLATCYAHQSAMNVSAGQSVSRGQIIGRVGNTGNSTGAHLHFEVRVGGNPVDPRGYL